jgi:long-chain fatty acid transport protein
LNLSAIASPASVGTAGAANVVNNEGPDSSFTNPAGMTGLDVDTFLAGIQALIPNLKFDSSIAPTTGGSDGGNAGKTAAIPAAYLVKVLSEDTRFGLSVVAPVGGGVDYGDNFVGRYQATKSTLEGISITPALAWKITDRLSVGGGFSFLYSRMDLDVALNQRAVDPTLTSDAKLKLDGIDDWSYFGTIGLQYQVTDRLLFGAVYRSKSEVELEGKIKFRNLQIEILDRITSKIKDIEMDYDLPQTVTAGLLFQATDHLRLMVNADWEDWSQFSDFGISLALDTVRRGATINQTADLKWKFLPADEQLEISAGWALRNEEIGSFTYSLGGSFLWLGDGKMDQTVQGERFKGEFDQNYIFFLAGSVAYKF